MTPYVIRNVGTSQHLHPSRFYRDIGPSRVHVISFMDFILDSECIYKPLTHGQGCNADTLALSDTVLERLISKEVIRDTRLVTISLTMTHICAIRVARLGHTIQGWWKAYTMSPVRYILRHFQSCWSRIDFGEWSYGLVRASV